MYTWCVIDHNYPVTYSNTCNNIWFLNISFCLWIDKNCTNCECILWATLNWLCKWIIFTRFVILCACRSVLDSSCFGWPFVLSVQNKCSRNRLLCICIQLYVWMCCLCVYILYKLLRFRMYIYVICIQFYVWMCVYKLLSFSVSGSVFAFLLLLTLSSYPLYPKVQHKAYAIKKINCFYFLIIFLWVYTCSRQNVMCLCSCTSQDACNQLSIIAHTHTYTGCTLDAEMASLPCWGPRTVKCYPGQMGLLKL